MDFSGFFTTMETEIREMIDEAESKFINPLVSFRKNQLGKLFSSYATFYATRPFVCSVFLRLFCRVPFVFLKMAFDRLFQVQLGYIGLGYCPMGGYANGPAGLEQPTGARNNRKATVQKRTENRPLRSVATKGNIPILPLLCSIIVFREKN